MFLRINLMIVIGVLLDCQLIFGQAPKPVVGFADLHTHPASGAKAGETNSSARSNSSSFATGMSQVGAISAVTNSCVAVPAFRPSSKP